MYPIAKICVLFQIALLQQLEMRYRTQFSPEHEHLVALKILKMSTQMTSSRKISFYCERTLNVFPQTSIGKRIVTITSAYFYSSQYPSEESVQRRGQFICLSPLICSVNDIPLPRTDIYAICNFDNGWSQFRPGGHRPFSLSIDMKTTVRAECKRGETFFSLNKLHVLLVIPFVDPHLLQPVFKSSKQTMSSLRQCVTVQSTLQNSTATSLEADTE